SSSSWCDSPVEKLTAGKDKRALSEEEVDQPAVKPCGRPGKHDARHHTPAAAAMKPFVSTTPRRAGRTSNTGTKPKNKELPRNTRNESHANSSRAARPRSLLTSCWLGYSTRRRWYHAAHTTTFDAIPSVDNTTRSNE